MGAAGSAEAGGGVMDQIFESLDKFSAIGSYYLATSAFILTVAALIFSVYSLRGSLKIYNDQKILENEQRKSSNSRDRMNDAFEIFKIILGLRDLRDDESGTGKTVMTAHVSAALVALRQYPEFYDALIIQREFFKRQEEDTAHNIWVRAQIDATFRYWEANFPEQITANSFLDSAEVIKKLAASKQINPIGLNS
jgi:hypothetical protein